MYNRYSFPALLIAFFTACILCSSTAFGQSKLEATESKALMNVSVTDFSQKVLPGEILIFRSKRSGKAVKRMTDADGKFQILLPKGDTYAVSVKNFLESQKYTEIEVPNEPGLIEGSLDVEWEIEENAVYELDIHFETDKAVIYQDSYDLLDELVAMLNRKKSIKIEIAGHTDSDGSEAHNLQLSRDRAAAARSYLLSKGIAGARVTSVGYGESKPVADNGTDAGKARNRRTEVRITEQ